MVGSKHIKIWDNKSSYDLTLKRRITIIIGDSATGKSKLVDLVSNKDINPGVRYSSNCGFSSLGRVKALDAELEANNHSVLFVDEDTGLFLNSQFLDLVFKYDIWFVFITRKDNILNLPYSVKEVYQLKSSGKYHTIIPYYDLSRVNSKQNKDWIITEDSKSGKEFFKKLGYDVLSAGGNDSLVKYINRSRCTFVVDSANFGRQMYSFYELAVLGKIDLVLPESFEYMLLKSSMFKNDKEVQDVLSNTQDYVTSEFKTWENFYEYFLDKILKKYRKEGYSKSRLSECFYKDCCCRSSLCDLSRSGITNKVKDILIQNNLEYLAYPQDFMQMLKQFTTNPTQEEIDRYYEMWRCNNL